MNTTLVLGVIVGVITSVASGILLFKITSWLKKMDKKGDRKEEQRQRECFLILKNIDAIGTLAELTAVCVKNERVNGNLDKAFKYREQMKHELEDFLMQGNAGRGQ